MNKDLTISQDIHTGLQVVTALKADIDTLAANCSLIQVVDESTLAIGQQNLSKATSMVNFIEEKRVLIKEKPLREGKFIDSTCKDLTSSLVAAIASLKTQIKNWDDLQKKKEAEKQAELDRIAKEEAAKAEAEAKRKQDIQDYINNTAVPILTKLLDGATSVEKCDSAITKIETSFKPREFFQEFADQAYKLKDNYTTLIRAKKDQLTSANTMSDSEREIVRQKEENIRLQNELTQREVQIKAAEEKLKAEQEAKQREIDLQAEREKLANEAALNKTKGVRYSWDFELVDINDVPKDWLMLDGAKVKEFIKAKKDSLKEGIVDGVKFFKKPIVTA